MRPALRRAGVVGGGFAVVVVAWGGNYPFLVLGLGSAPPLLLMLLRATVGLALAVPLTYATGRAVRLSAGQRWIALGLGTFGYGGFLALWALASPFVAPGETSVYIYTFPLWVLFLSIPLLHERPPPLKFVGAVVGFIGVALVAGVASRVPTFNAVALSELLAAAVAWALSTVLAKQRFRREEMLSANLWQLVGGLLVLAPLALALEPIGAIHWTGSLLLVVLWIGGLGTAVAYALWYDLLSKYNAASLSAGTFLVVVVAFVVSFVIFGETVTPTQLVGVAAIVTAIYVVGRSSRGSSAVPAPPLDSPLTSRSPSDAAVPGPVRGRSDRPGDPDDDGDHHPEQQQADPLTVSCPGRREHP